jgi:hypothetical protein
LTFLLIVAFCIAPVPGANAAPSYKFGFLLRFFDFNEAAFAYHRHCLGRTEPINRNFVKAMDMVAADLYEEGVRNNPDLKPEQISSKILERKYNLQYKLDNTNMKEGCLSKDSEAAKTHYRDISRYSEAEIISLIDQKTK